MSTGTSAGDQIIKVAAVDDHPIVRDGIANWITGADAAEVTGAVWVVATAARVDALLAGPGRDADVVLLDLDLQDGTTVEDNVAAILGARPAVLVLAASDRPVSVRAAIRAGALGYVLKSEEAGQVRQAIATVAAGERISPRLASSSPPTTRRTGPR